MPPIPEKLTNGEPLSTEELIEYLPQLKEVPMALLKQFAVGAAVRRRFREGDIVCEEGTFGSTAFFVVSGHVDIYINNPMAQVRTKPRGFFSFFKTMSSSLVRGDSQEVAEQGFIPIDASIDLPRSMPLAWLGPGEIFGEMTCRTFQPRAATVRATEDCVMVEMLRVILDMLLGTRDPDAATKAAGKIKAPTFKGTSFKKLMDDKYRSRSLVTHLRSVPLFATLDMDFFSYLKEHAELVSCNKGEVICKQGDKADAFYLIRSGLVRVSQSLPGGEMVRTYLKRGEFFGEIGLLMDQPRNASCAALDAVDLVRIKAEDFGIMLLKFPAVRETLQKVAQARIEADKVRKVPVGLQLDEFLNQGLFEAQNLLLIDLDNCTRCDACVNACADAHDGISRLIRDGLRYDRFLVATACRSCRDPLCMTQCPVGSIRRKETLEIIIEDWCIGCGKCAELCPYGNINMHSFEVKKEVPATEKKPATPAKPAAAPAAKAALPPPAKPEAKPVEKPEAAPAPAAPPPAQPEPKPVEKAEPPPADAAAAPAKPEAPKAEAPAPAKPAAPAAKPAPAKPAAPKAPVKMVLKKMTVQKATTCDLCTQLSVPSCVYACPHDAAKRVEPTEFLAKQIGRGSSTGHSRLRWLGARANRTTHT